MAASLLMGAAGRVGDGFTQHSRAAAAGEPMVIALTKIVDVDCDVGHRTQTTSAKIRSTRRKKNAPVTKEHERCEARRPRWSGRGLPAPEKRPADTLDNAHEWIETIDRPPGLRQETRGIGDGSGEKPDLDEERNRVLNVSVLDIQGRKPKADAQSGDESQDGEAGTQRNEARTSSNPYHQTIPSKTSSARPRSGRPPSTRPMGTKRRGKYTFVIRGRCGRGCWPTESTRSRRNCQGTRAANAKSG